MEIGEVERRLFTLVMAVERAATEEFLVAEGTGYAGKEIAKPHGSRIPYVCDRSCVYRSIFGTIPIPRDSYYADGSRGDFPVEGELNLPERGYSYLAQEILSSFFPANMEIRSPESLVGVFAMRWIPSMRRRHRRTDVLKPWSRLLS